MDEYTELTKLAPWFTITTLRVEQRMKNYKVSQVYFYSYWFTVPSALGRPLT